MFTVDVDVVLQEGVGHAKEKMLRGLNYLKLEALLSFFWNGQRTVQACEVASLLEDFSSHQFVIFEERRKRVDDEVEDCAVGMPMKVELVHPPIVFLLIALRDPAEFHEPVDCPRDGLQIAFFSLAKELLL